MRTILGTSVAREMCLTGRSYDARKALEAGFVNRVVEPAELEGAVVEVAEGMKRRFASSGRRCSSERLE
jgi:enoyl-CoA hydratase/carnithine racemase